MTVECCDCKTRQGVNENCVNCGLKFGQVVRLRILAFKFVSVLFLVHIPVVAFLLLCFSEIHVEDLVCFVFVRKL